MFDFRLKVFYVVAKRLNFTKAASELFISQPAVSKHIHEIEEHYQVKLFDRNGTRIVLTQAGILLFDQVDQLMDIYRNIDLGILALSNPSKGTLRIGASTTVAQYYLPKHLASFKEKFPDVELSLVSDNTETIEKLLGENKIDFGIVEGHSKRHHLKYTSVVKDEMVLCTRSKNNRVKKSMITTDDLISLPIVFREPGSGSLEVIASALKSKGLDLSELMKEIELQSTESIKSYLLHSNAYAFLSVHSIYKELKDDELKIIDIKGMDIERSFYFVTQQGGVHHLSELFFRHISMR